jgi:hypothetical protein
MKRLILLKVRALNIVTTSRNRLVVRLLTVLGFFDVLKFDQPSPLMLVYHFGAANNVQHNACYGGLEQENNNKR